MAIRIPEKQSKNVFFSCKDKGKLPITLNLEIWTGTFLMQIKTILNWQDILILHYKEEAAKPEAWDITLKM